MSRPASTLATVASSEPTVAIGVELPDRGTSDNHRASKGYLRASDLDRILPANCCNRCKFERGDPVPSPSVGPLDAWRPQLLDAARLDAPDAYKPDVCVSMTPFGAVVAVLALYP